MHKFTADELHTKADTYEKQIAAPHNSDDPKWLQRWANRIRRLAFQKEKLKNIKYNKDNPVINISS